MPIGPCRALILLIAVAAASLWSAERQAELKDEQNVLACIAFGSCARQNQPQPIWETIIAAKPNLFLFMGDNIYGDTTDMNVLRGKYKQLGEQPGYQALKKICPVLATWDDHDYGENDAGKEFAPKTESQKVLVEFFEDPKESPRHNRPGVYLSACYGPPEKCVQVILLDTRYFRDALARRTTPRLPAQGPYGPTSDEKATILGADQWSWLREQLQVPARLRLIVSSIQVGAEAHGFEQWANFPAEQRRFFDLLKETKAAGVLVLSGDRHFAEITRVPPEQTGLKYPLYDITASSLNQALRNVSPNALRVGETVPDANFGLLRIDWSQADPQLTVEIRDTKGAVRLQQALPLSALNAE